MSYDKVRFFKSHEILVTIYEKKYVKPLISKVNQFICTCVVVFFEIASKQVIVYLKSS